eukprot:181198_1
MSAILFVYGMQRAYEQTEILAAMPYGSEYQFDQLLLLDHGVLWLVLLLALRVKIFNARVLANYQLLHILQKQLNYYMVQSYAIGVHFFAAIITFILWSAFSVIFLITIYIVLFILFNKNQTETKAKMHNQSLAHSKQQKFKLMTCSHPIDVFINAFCICNLRCIIFLLLYIYL